jgi:hypothetical protein
LKPNVFGIFEFLEIRVNDQIVFSQVNTDISSGFHWRPKAKKNGGTLHFEDQKIKLERIPSTNTSAGKWIKFN